MCFHPAKSLPNTAGPHSPPWCAIILLASCGFLHSGTQTGSLNPDSESIPYRPIAPASHGSCRFRCIMSSPASRSRWAMLTTASGSASSASAGVTFLEGSKGNHTFCLGGLLNKCCTFRLPQSAGFTLRTSIIQVELGNRQMLTGQTPGQSGVLRLPNFCGQNHAASKEGHFKRDLPRRSVSFEPSPGPHSPVNLANTRPRPSPAPPQEKKHQHLPFPPFEVQKIPPPGVRVLDTRKKEIRVASWSLAPGDPGSQSAPGRRCPASST